MKIPDCREDEYYNEKYLNEEDSQYVSGYDNCVEYAIDSFFCNLDIFEDDFNDEDIKFTEEMDNVLADERDFSDFSEEEQKNMSQVTKIIKILKDSLLDYVERERDDLITSLLDNMNDEEYDKLKNDVDSGVYKNAIIRQREYQKRLDTGEIPTSWIIKKDEETGKIVKIGKCPNGDTIIKEKDD